MLNGFMTLAGQPAWLLWKAECGMIRRYAVLGVLLVAGPLLIRLFSASVDDLLGFRAVFVPVARLYLYIFNSEMTAVYLCLGMVMFGLGIVAYFWWQRIAPAVRDLRTVTAQLQSIDSKMSGEAKLAAIDAAISPFKLLSNSWSLYRATLISQDDRVASQFQPVVYFNLRMLEHAGVRLRSFLSLPNDFVGLGLVFTFLGLVAGLYFASRSMMSADLKTARDALVQLLHAATFKFLTSITGIGMSLLISLVQRMMLDRLDSRLSELQYALEALLPLAHIAGPAPWTAAAPAWTEATVASVGRRSV
jgi:hypothetical protein